MAFDFPSSPTVGTTYQPAGGPAYRYNGVAWDVVPPAYQIAIPSDTPLANPVNGQLWWETDTGLLYVYYNDGTSAQWVQLPVSGSSGMVIDRVYLASGTWTKPAGLKYLNVEGCGGGGSGSAAIATGAGVFSFGASGGGAAWGRKLYAAADLAASVAFTVGLGGASSSGAGIAGGATIFSGMNLPGGTGGPQGSNTTGTGVIGPASMTASPTGVDFGSPGAQGGMSIVLPAAWNLIGPSGSGPYGAPTAMLGGSSGQVGAAGYGSGSSGCFNPASSGLKTSAAGQPGILMLREFY